MNRNVLKTKTHSQSSWLTPRNPLYRKWLNQYTFAELDKDTGSGDLTTKACFPKNKRAASYILVKESGVLAGVQEISYFLKKIHSLQWRFLKKDGVEIKPGERVLKMAGPIYDLMKLERVILNLLGRMSGVATLTRRFVEKACKKNPTMLITPTRKTLWGLLDKRACVLGGGGTHRLSLDNAILIKHNHIKARNQPLPQILKSVLESRISKKAQFVEVEVRNGKDAVRAAQIFAQAKKNKFPLPCCIMFDNMSPKKVAKIVAFFRKTGLSQDVLLEASGRISEKNIAAYAKTGVDVLSVGAITHSASMLDVSMRMA